MQEYIEQIEKVLGRTITNAEYQICYELYEKYCEGDIIHHIELYKYKDKPIHYTRTVLIKSNIQKKNESSGTSWWDNLKKQL